VTLKRDIADLESVALRQRVLRDVSTIDLSTSLFEQRMSMPVLLAPISHGLNARRGEVQAARAVTKRAFPFVFQRSRCARPTCSIFWGPK
jgi:L-lactate dehydrogenase (cytochrome)